MPSNHLILCYPLLLLPSIFPSIRVFSNELVLCIRWPKYWSFSFSINPCNEYSVLISFRTDWLELLAVQRTLKRCLQHHISFFFSFFKIYFNWRLVTLQYCGGFCHTFTWISHGCTCVPHPDAQHHISKASILRCSAFFTVQLSHPYMTTGKTIALMGNGRMDDSQAGIKIAGRISATSDMHMTPL